MMDSLIETPEGETPEDDEQQTDTATETQGGDAPERPDYIPEKFWDAEKGAPNIENLAKSYAELEKGRHNVDELKAKWEEERLAARPEAPDDYQLPENELLDPDQLAASPVVRLWREAAHEAGLGQKQFEGVLNRYAETEIARLKEQAKAELEALGDNGKQRADAVGLWAKQAFKDEAEYDAILQVGSTAAGVKALERLMQASKESGLLPEGDGAVDEGDTLEDIRALMNTREYWDPKDRDPKVVARVEAFFAKQK